MFHARILALAHFATCAHASIMYMKKKRYSIIGTRNNILLAENIRTMYLQGKSYDYICSALNISKNTINTYRRNALKEGDDWDMLMLVHRRNSQAVSMSEAYFINKLIDSFEKQITNNPDLSLDELAKFTKIYYQLKQPKTIDTKEVEHANTQVVIKAIAKLAVDLNRREVVEFLSVYADEIIRAVFKSNS
ncbi:DUF1804 family protein [Helicobacter suis]|uniref:DUF1804 family protein n=1 Tax=Helicobacter suis TaxID=104628 RepID=UPI001F0729EA|nr:DUF1804 family protein [Helicobacter suis]